MGESAMLQPMQWLPEQQDASDEQRCPGCNRAMKFVGREISSGTRSELLTFQCDCGQVFTRRSRASETALVRRSRSEPPQPEREPPQTKRDGFPSFDDILGAW